jgi:hypothetical protein
MKKHLIGAAALALGLVLLCTAVASGAKEEVRVGNLTLSDNGGISPQKLPRKGSAPVTAHLIGEIGTVDGSHPPALKTVDIDVDKTISIDAVGVPVCRAQEIQARSSTSAKRACADAIVGSGKAEVEVAFPEQAPFSATGPVTIFNGGVKGNTTTVLLHAYVSVPAPTAIVAKATVTKIHKGRFGLRILAQLPKIAGGSGSVTKFTLEVGRTYTYKGKKKSYLSASCPTGSWATKGQVSFTDGSQLGILHVFPCTPTG